MVILNPKIPQSLKDEFTADPSLPNGLCELVERLLAIESKSGASSDEGISKLYDQVLDRFIDDNDLMKWSKDYVG